MGNGAHGQHVMCWIMCNFLNTAWIFTKILLNIDIDVFYLNILQHVCSLVMIGSNMFNKNILAYILANISVISWSFFKIFFY